MVVACWQSITAHDGAQPRLVAAVVNLPRHQLEPGPVWMRATSPGRQEIRFGGFPQRFEIGGFVAIVVANEASWTCAQLHRRNDPHSAPVQRSSDELRRHMKCEGTGSRDFASSFARAPRSNADGIDLGTRRAVAIHRGGMLSPHDIVDTLLRRRFRWPSDIRGKGPTGECSAHPGRRLLTETCVRTCETSSSGPRHGRSRDEGPAWARDEETRGVRVGIV